jgi:hypothetical protein
MVSEVAAASTTDRNIRLNAGWERVGGALGLLSVLVLAGGPIGFGLPSSLTSSSTPTAISAYLSSHGSSVLTLTLTTVLGGAIGLWFIATVARLLHQADSHSPLGMIALAFGAVATAISAFDGVTLSVLVYLHRQGGPTDPALTRALFDLQNGLIMPGLFGFFVAGFLAAVGVAMIRGQLARPWTGWLTLVLAALAVAGAATGLTSVSGGTTLIGYSPVISYGIFALITSIYLLRDRPKLTAF